APGNRQHGRQVPVDEAAKGLALARGHPREKTNLLPVVVGAGLRERSGSALVRKHAEPRVPPMIGASPVQDSIPHSIPEPTAGDRTAAQDHCRPEARRVMGLAPILPALARRWHCPGTVLALSWHCPGPNGGTAPFPSAPAHPSWGHIQAIKR